MHPAITGPSLPTGLSPCSSEPSFSPAHGLISIHCWPSREPGLGAGQKGAEASVLCEPPGCDSLRPEAEQHLKSVSCPSPPSLAWASSRWKSPLPIASHSPSLKRDRQRVSHRQSKRDWLRFNIFLVHMQTRGGKGITRGHTHFSGFNHLRKLSPQAHVSTHFSFPYPTAKSLQSCLTPCDTIDSGPQTAAHQAPPSLGFSRQEYWSGVPFPILPLPETQVSLKNRVKSCWAYLLFE